METPTVAGVGGEWVVGKRIRESTDGKGRTVFVVFPPCEQRELLTISRVLSLLSEHRPQAPGLHAEEGAAGPVKSPGTCISACFRSAGCTPFPF